MFWDKFVLLCNKKGKTPNGVCMELNFSNATATKWKNGSMPRSTTLHKIAEYFGVSVDYLIGPTIKKIAKSNGVTFSSLPEDIPTEFTTMEIDRSEFEELLIIQKQKILDACENLSPEQLEKVVEYVEFISAKKRSGD